MLQSTTPIPSPTPSWIDWASQPIPNEWQWVGFFAGITGLVLGAVALPSALQMIVGQPRVTIEFGTSNLFRPTITDPVTQVFECWLRNPPITNRVLRWMRIRRATADDLSAWFTICEAGSGLVIHDTVPARIKTQINDELRERISLPASTMQAGFPIALHNVTGNGPTSACVFSMNPMPFLGKGTFLIRVLIAFGEDRVRDAVHLVVQEDEVYWRPLSVGPPEQRSRRT